MLSEGRKKCFSDFFGFLIVSISGCINHFLYQLSGGSSLLAPFVPINESIWEHLKLLFFPYVVLLLIEFFLCGREIPGFLFSGITGVLCGLIFIPSAYYLYTGITGKNFFLIDILIFFAAVYLSFRIRSSRLSKEPDNGIMKNISAFILIFCLSVLFAGFTFFPPDSPLFENPL